MKLAVSGTLPEVKQALSDKFTDLQKQYGFMMDYIPNELEKKYSTILKQIKEAKDAKKLIALDIRPNAVKLAEIGVKDTGCDVSNYSIDYLEKDNAVELLYGILKTSLTKNKIITKDAVIALSGEDVSFKLIDLPQMPEKEIDQAIKHKIENIAGIPAEKLIFDYYKTDSIGDSGKQFYFASYISKEYADKIAVAAQKAGLNVKAIMPATSALKNLYPSTEKAPLCLVNLGKYSSLILLMKAGKAVFAREVQVGSDTITHSMTGVVVAGSERIEIDAVKAEDLRNRFGVPLDFDAYTKESGLPASEIMAMMRPALEKIGAEILRTFEYYKQETQDKSEFKKIYMTGGGSRMNNFAQYLTEELSLEVKAADVKAFAKDKKSQDILPHLSISLGAASSNKNNLNLLPFEFASPLAYAALRSLNIYSVSAAYAVILFLIYAWFSYAVSGSAAREHKSLEAAYKSLNVASPGQNITPEMQNLLAAFSDKRHGERFASVMKELYSLTPDGIYFRSLDYSNSADKVVIKGVIVKRESSGISKFVKALKNGSIFRGVDISFMQSSSQFTVPTVEFEIDCALRGQE